VSGIGNLPSTAGLRTRRPSEAWVAPAHSSSSAGAGAPLWRRPSRGRCQKPTPKAPQWPRPARCSVPGAPFLRHCGQRWRWGSLTWRLQSQSCWPKPHFRPCDGAVDGVEVRRLAPRQVGGGGQAGDPDAGWARVRREAARGAGGENALHPPEATNTGPGFNRGPGATPGDVTSKNEYFRTPNSAGPADSKSGVQFFCSTNPGSSWPLIAVGPAAAAPIGGMKWWCLWRFCGLARASPIAPSPIADHCAVQRSVQKTRFRCAYIQAAPRVPCFGDVRCAPGGVRIAHT